jgi:hypothetical protein
MSKKLTLLAFLAALFSSAESYAANALAKMTGQHPCQRLGNTTKPGSAQKKAPAAVIQICINEHDKLIKGETAADREKRQGRALYNLCLPMRGEGLCQRYLR